MIRMSRKNLSCVIVHTMAVWRNGWLNVIGKIKFQGNLFVAGFFFGIFLFDSVRFIFKSHIFISTHYMSQKCSLFNYSFWPIVLYTTDKYARNDRTEFECPLCCSLCVTSLFVIGPYSFKCEWLQLV